jgi:hypothetical protein
MAVEYEGKTYRSAAYPYDGDVIWGATARIMENLVEILGEKILNPLSILDVKHETGKLFGSPDHQQGVRCKAPRSDD